MNLSVRIIFYLGMILYPMRLQDHSFLSVAIIAADEYKEITAWFIDNNL